MAEGRRRNADEHLGAELTSRELEVLGAMTDGLSTKAVAHHLGIAVKTVENHKTRIFDKLGVHSQAQAVAMAIGANAVLVRPRSRSGNRVRRPGWSRTAQAPVSPEANGIEVRGLSKSLRGGPSSPTSTSWFPGPRSR